MGGNKSKPVTESARSVLMRRGREEAQKAPNIVNTAATSSGASKVGSETSEGVHGEVSSEQTAPLNTDIDPVILNEISKWSFVRISDKPPKQVVTKGEPSAAIIRMREIKEREGLSPAELKLKNVGRLSEEEMIKLFTKLREDSSSENTLKLANEFRISQLNIETLHKYCRVAIVTPPAEGEVYPLAS